MNMKLDLNICFRELDWKPVPDEICDRIFQFMENSHAYENQDYHKHGITQFEFHAAPNYLEEWCRENLPIDDDLTVAIQRITSDVPPHVDSVTRESSFNFLITKDDVVTTWFDPSYKHIEVVVYETRKWYHHQGSVIHAVTGVNAPRIAVTIFKDLYNI